MGKIVLDPARGGWFASIQGQLSSNEFAAYRAGLAAAKAERCKEPVVGFFMSDEAVDVFTPFLVKAAVPHGMREAAPETGDGHKPDCPTMLDSPKTENEARHRRDCTCPLRPARTGPEGSKSEPPRTTDLRAMRGDPPLDPPCNCGKPKSEHWDFGSGCKRFRQVAGATPVSFVHRPYQEEGISWIEDQWSRFDSCFLADQPGLGKTIQSSLAIPRGCRTVVICPASVKRTWLVELAKFRPDLKTEALYGRDSFRWPEPNEVVILNSEIFPKRFRECPDCVFVIVDEAHVYSQKSQRTNRLRVLVRESIKHGGKTLGMSGTPLWKDPQGLWVMYTSLQISQRIWIPTGDKDGFDHFVEDFGATYDRFGQISWPEKPVTNIKAKLDAAMLRRLKTDVLDDLPGITYQDIPCDIDTSTRRKADRVMAELDAMGLTLEDIVDAQATADRAAAILDEKRKNEFTKEEWQAARQRLLGLLAEAREALVRAKMPNVLEFVKDNYEATDEAVVVFSAHRIAVEALQRRDGWSGILGGTAKGKRQEILNDFLAGKTKWLAATIASVGVGLNELVAASHGVFVDYAFTPTANSQAVDRLWRIGQKNAVMIRRFVADHDLDRRVLVILQARETRNAAVLGDHP